MPADTPLRSRRVTQMLDAVAELNDCSTAQAVEIVLEQAASVARDVGEVEPEETRQDRTVRYLWGLRADYLRRLRELSTVRADDDLGQTYWRATTQGAMATIPRRLTRSSYALPHHLEELGVAIADVGVDGDNRPWVELDNGRVFHNIHSPTKFRNMYYLLRDVIDSRLTADTYVMAVDVCNRYLWRGRRHSKLPGPGGVIVEAGAFIGMKAIRYAEIVGDTGRVIPIEISRSNFDVMVANIEANDLGHVVSPVLAGVWSEPGMMESKSRGGAFHALAPSDHHDHLEGRLLVRTDTLDNIIDDADVDVVDYLNLQLNGTEIEGLQGLDRRFDDVRVFRVASYYSRDGRPNADVVIDMLQRRGATVLARSAVGLVTAVGRRWADDYR